MRAAFLALLKQTVTIEPFSSDNAHNDATYGTGVEYKARVESYTPVNRSYEGLVGTPAARVFVNGNVTVGVRDRITLPIGWKPTLRFVVDVAEHPDETGNVHHKEIIC